MNCIHEKELRTALLTGRIQGSLEQHVRSCEDCRSFASMQRAMTMVAEAPIAEKALPDPALIWLKGQILRHQRMEAQIVRPMKIVQFAAQIAVALGWAALFTWKWPQILSLTTDFSISKLIGTSISTGFSTSTISVMLTLVLITAASMFQAVFAEE